MSAVTFYGIMKNLSLALIMIFSTMAVHAQELASSGADVPLGFYEEINLSLSGDHVKDALQTFSKLIAHYKSTHQLQKLPESYFGMALALALNGHYKASIHYHKLAIRSQRKVYHQDSIEMSINLGLTYLLAGKGRRAQRLLGEYQLGS